MTMSDQDKLCFPDQGSRRFDEAHTTVARPAVLAAVPNGNVLRRVRVRTKVWLDKVTEFFNSEAEGDGDPVDVAGVQPNRVPLRRHFVLLKREAPRGTGISQSGPRNLA